MFQCRYFYLKLSLLTCLLATDATAVSALQTGKEQIPLIELNNSETRFINPEIEYFRADNKNFAFEDVMKLPENTFKKNSQGMKNFGISKEATHWFHFRVINNMPKEKWLFFFDFSHLEEVDFYYKNTEGIIIHSAAGDNRDINLSPLKSRLPAFYLSNSSGVTDYYIRVYTRFAQVFPMGIITQDKFLQREFKYISFFTILMGISLATLIYNIIVAFISSKIIFLYYAVYIISLNLIEMVTAGLSFPWIYRTESDIGQRIALISMPFFTAAGLLFNKHLYGINGTRPTLKKLLNLLFLLQIGVLANAVFNQLIFAYIISWIDTAIYGFFALGVSFYMIRSENRRIAIMSIFAWIPLMASAFWLYAGYLDTVAFSQSNAFLLNIAVAAEQILFLMLAVFWWKNLSEDARILQDRIQELKIKTMDQKMNPHFLYNSLNMILGMLNQGGTMAQETVRDLIEIYKFMSKHVEKDLVPLKDEWQFVLKYYRVMNKRVGNITELEEDLPEALTGFMVPPLTLQPLVENCFKHGYKAGKTETFRIGMFARVWGDGLILSVADNGSASKDFYKPGGALVNIKLRLQHYYPDVNLTVQTPEGGGTRIDIVIKGKK